MQEYKCALPLSHMPRYLQLINQTNKLLNKICSIFLVYPFKVFSWWWYIFLNFFVLLIWWKITTDLDWIFFLVITIQNSNQNGRLIGSSKREQCLSLRWCGSASVLETFPKSYFASYTLVKTEHITDVCKTSVSFKISVPLAKKHLIWVINLVVRCKINLLTGPTSRKKKKHMSTYTHSRSCLSS